MQKSEWMKSLVAQLTSEKGRDYTYLTLFFLIFSVFIFAAIRPSLKTAFALKKEQVDLEALNAQYEDTIAHVITIQQGLEQIREGLPLISEAIPPRPNVNKLIADIQATGTANSVILSEVSVGEVNLIERGSKLVKTLTINMEAQASYSDMIKFLTELSSQRRLKLADTIEIKKKDVSKEATPSAGGALTITMKIEGFHL